jgi:hypothetical protein
MENQYENQGPQDVNVPQMGFVANFESKIADLLKKVDNGNIFKNIIDFVFKALAYLFLVFGILSTVSNIFGDDGYFSRFDYLEGVEKFTAVIGFLIGLAVCLLVIYIVFTVISNRANQLKSESYDGILSYLYKNTFPVLIVIFGEVLSVLTLTVGMLFVFANLLGSMVYFPLSDIVNTMSDMLDLGIGGDTSIFIPGNWDYFSEGMKMSFGIIVLSPIILIGTYVFRAIYNYCVKLIIKLIEFSTSKNGILVLFIGVVLSYIVMDGILIEILEEIF